MGSLNGTSDGEAMWAITEATERAMRLLRPPGHMPTPQEERRISQLMDARSEASREGDLEAFRETMIYLHEAACASYRRHIEDPTTSPEIPGAKQTSRR